MHLKNHEKNLNNIIAPIKLLQVKITLSIAYQVCVNLFNRQNTKLFFYFH